jgi:bacteriocin-like protein
MNNKNNKFNELNIDEMQDINGGSIGTFNPYINYDEVAKRVNELLNPLHFTYGNIITSNILKK